jgi:tetratricopeptide (TPR) repeat protein
MKHDNGGGPEQGGEAEVKTAVEYVKEARALVKSGRRKDAYSILLQASRHYPNHPVILSYCGWLQAVVDRKQQSGLAACRKAFVLFKTSDPAAAGRVYPVLYLNLGRTLLLARKKKEAVENFEKGLTYDKSNVELKQEMKVLGTRKQPPVPFLSRSNPINKLIGKIVHEKSRKRDSPDRSRRF